ncbi:MAG: zincin-like metallopeptidase domain-containing protein [Bacteroidetes bacterium]|nr:zincin-like metallopeptidase domain-containing protein [Bacteroidota bacterium]
MNNSQIYAAITEKIIANLETAGSWMKLWQVPSPVSMNGHYYRGINRLVLSSDPHKSRVYGTFQQIRTNGGQVRKGEKSTIVVFWKTGLEQDEITGITKKTFLLRFYHVFNSEQADFDEQGKQKIAQLQSLVNEKVNDEHLEAEAIIEGYEGRPEIIFSDKDDRAYYAPVADLISVPDKKYFTTSSAFYRVLYHELVHSVGHPKRLNRFDGMSNSYGDIPYSKEELIAELGSSFLSGIAHLDMDIRNSAAYIKGWVSALRDNQKWIMWAAARAEKSADYILGIDSSYAASEEKTTAEVTSEVPVIDPVLDNVPF